MRRAPSLALVGVLSLFACSESEQIVLADREVCLAKRSGGEFCIETYEASRKDARGDSPGTDETSPPRSVENVLPWVDLPWQSAKEACARKGKRLCERDEWIDACDGVVGEAEGRRYTYGNTVTSTSCNVSGGPTETTGKRLSCRSGFGTFDQSGNVWEWTGGTAGSASTRGGSWASSQTHTCKGPDSSVVIVTQGSPQVGFRCCRDL